MKEARQPILIQALEEGARLRAPRNPAEQMKLVMQGMITEWVKFPLQHRFEQLVERYNKSVPDKASVAPQEVTELQPDEAVLVAHQNGTSTPEVKRRFHL